MGITLDTHGFNTNNNINVNVTLLVSAGDLIVVGGTAGVGGVVSLTVADNVNAGNYLVAVPAEFDSTSTQLTGMWYLTNVVGGN